MSLAAYVPKVTTGSSPFANLIKQSKFATFDPQIAQVYTTSGGDAFRGNWGFKRPLPIRRRAAYITVKAVDTKEKQTEWNSAEMQGLWIKNWGELKLEAERSSGNRAGLGPSQGHDGVHWIADSDYAPNTTHPSTWRTAMVPNIHAMNRTEFQNHVEHTRSERKDFYEFLQTQHNAKSRNKSFYQLANGQNRSSAWHDAWERNKSQKRRLDPRSRDMEEVPHRTAGLSYCHYSPLQTFLMTEPRKGRLVEEEKGDKRASSRYVASFAGMGAIVPKGSEGMNRVMEYGDPSRTGEMKFRAQSAALRKAPVVVGLKREGLKAATMDLYLREWESPNHARSNTHKPGSREYVGAVSEAPWASPEPRMSMTAPGRNRVDRAVQQASFATNSLASLSRILDREKQ
ncbi:mitochondrial ribosomal protein subunit-domain-containing protein [Hygrophoropsis aurantiaca]|uniref:Mitochondrial ribosomal protein subunit-domain-containing protein n=1 Tax=Hygrophoropsis aurantiaca TaxID=72124 RepID=A0ACB8AN96_9AGAM|nr:mitochondrial ribosomal protein subunit-domain-containing protein [Hygrophoropsis aurantiaca]